LSFLFSNERTLALFDKFHFVIITNTIFFLSPPPADASRRDDSISK
jgi:hypothetical protein